MLTSGKNSKKNSRKQRNTTRKPAESGKREFYEELSDCLGDNPKIIPVAKVSSAKAVASMNQREEASTTDDSNDESSTFDSTSPKKRRKETPKTRRRSKSSASEMIDFLKGGSRKGDFDRKNACRQNVTVHRILGKKVMAQARVQ